MATEELLQKGGADVALITGCASGIGRALALELSRQKTPAGGQAFSVIATDADVSALKGLKSHGIEVLELDVTSPESIKQTVEHILVKAGRIDVMICNAGVHCGGFLAEIDYADVERTFEVNLHGVFRMAQAVTPHMMANRKGKIVTMNDVNSYFARPFNGPYQGSKAALAMMSEGFSMEVERFGVTVTSVCGGWVRTGFLRNGLTDYSRYEKPSSYYFKVVGYFRNLFEHFAGLGPSPEEAAAAIVKAIAPDAPPRFVYLGASTWSTLWAGYFQNWVSNRAFAWYLLRATGMNKLWTAPEAVEAARKRQ